MTARPPAIGEIPVDELRAPVDAAIHGRRSVRAYRPDPVPQDELTAILESARWAPSPHNSEPWRFAVLRGLAAKERLATQMGAQWARDLGGDGVAPEMVTRELAESRRRITEAPIVVIVSLVGEGLDEYPDPKRQQAELMMAAHSVGAAVQNVMLAAYARGLATGWMCAPLFCPEVVVDALGLSRDLSPQGLITMGYPVEWPRLRKRRPMDDLVVHVS
jgi:coenzyme F420-0:L-glutamate ligase / coenzyme F420-1:gamma-L-glutamate ligase